MKKKLFQKSSMQQIKERSTLGNKVIDAKYSYINGYYAFPRKSDSNELSITIKTNKGKQ